MRPHYVLDGHVPQAIDISTLGGLMKWAKFMEDGEQRRVAVEHLCGGVRVSTVFLGLDHSFTGGRPVLFETMVFGGRQDGEMQRYHTWSEAEWGHYILSARVQFTEGSRGYSRSHWRKIRGDVLRAKMIHYQMRETENESRNIAD